MYALALLLLLHHTLIAKTTENANNQKLMADYEKYQELQARSQKLQEVSLDFTYKVEQFHTESKLMLPS